MGAVLIFIGIFFAIIVFLVGLGLGIGALLHWLVPAIGMEAGTLIGVVATGIGTYFFARLMALNSAPDPLEIAPEEIIRSGVTIYPSLPTLPPLPSRRGRKRRA